MSLRYLTEEEIENIRVQRGVARLSVGALEQRAGLRNQKLAEALRSRVKMSETEIACVFSNLATSQPIAADKGHRMICTRCKKHLTDPGETKCRVCKGETVTVGAGALEIDGKPVVSRDEQQVQQWAEKLAGMVTPVYDTIAKLRTEVFERFAQAENASIANADFAEAIHDRLKLIEKATPDPRTTPAELASRIEHCMQELSRQGKRLISVQTDLDDRVSALAQALAAHEKSKAAPVSAAETPRDPDIIVSFVNFERVCRQMYTKCPHLFAATVRRAAGA